MYETARVQAFEINSRLTTLECRKWPVHLLKKELFPTKDYLHYLANVQESLMTSETFQSYTKLREHMMFTKRLLNLLDG